MDMATLKQLRLEAGLQIKQLADNAGVTRQSITTAEKGGFIRADTARAIAGALSEALSQDIKVWQIEGLNVR